MPKIHPSITPERVLAIAEESLFGMTDEGICIFCGADQLHVESDAREYMCENCSEDGVYGAEALLHLVA